MFYLKINDKITAYIDKIPHIHFGCKYYCPHQFIALDEMEYLRKELAKINIVFTDEEYKELLKSTTSHYFHQTHICQVPDTEKEKEDPLESLSRDRISRKEPNPFVDFDKLEQNYKIRQKQQMEDEKLFNKSTTINKSSYNSFSYGFSMIASFFLLVLGSYYFGKQFLGLSESNTYKLVLVVTVIVFLSETCLLLLKIHKEQMTHASKERVVNNSFAYRFNKQYRNKIVNTNDPSVKSKTD